MSELRKRVIRLAHSQPELRPHLLPLLKEAQGGRPVPLTEDELYDVMEGSHVEKWDFNTDRWKPAMGYSRNPGKFWKVLQQHRHGLFWYIPQSGQILWPDQKKSPWRFQ